VRVGGGGHREARSAKPGGHRSRGAPVIRAVLGVTLDELARVGYAALTVEQVAVRAGVNKTTVYRRWPTKAGLVKTALGAAAGDAPAIRESGDIRADLLAVARRVSATMSSPRGRGVLRVLLDACPEPELVAATSAIRKRFYAPWRRLIGRAVLRGTLVPCADPDLLLDTVSGWIVQRLFRERAPVTAEHLRRLVDLLLLGVYPRSSRAARQGSRPARKWPGATGTGKGGT
jgi:AcrR family transcriptional regulator